jgi:putative endonuclease
MFLVYILFSESTGRFYVGHTADILDRVQRHNDGRSASTKSGRPWTLVFSEPYESRAEAMKREKQIKGWKSATAIHRLIGERPDL